jgi:hypothetical protein
MTATPVLDLSTERDQRIIRIDGSDYQMVNLNDLTLREGNAISKKSARIFELFSKIESLTDSEEVEALEVLDGCVGLIVPKIGDTLSRLSAIQKLKIVSVFLQPARVAPEPNPSTGKSTSRASSGSTAATPNRGSDSHLGYSEPS